MAKQTIHIGLAVSTDGFLPGKANIINLAAVVGSLGSFDANVLPPNGVYGASPFWSKHPEELEKLKVDPKPLAEVMANFRQWLKQWQGTLVACTSSLDFWHLFTAMLGTSPGSCPFGSVPLDTNSYYTGLGGLKTPQKLKGSVRPLDVAMERWQIVTSGVLPKFGEGPKKKLGTSSFGRPTQAGFDNTRESWSQYVNRIHSQQAQAQAAQQSRNAYNAANLVPTEPTPTPPVLGGQRVVYTRPSSVPTFTIDSVTDGINTTPPHPWRDRR